MALTTQEIKELANLIWLIDVYGQTSTKDNKRRMQLQQKMSEMQEIYLEKYLDFLNEEREQPTVKGIIRALSIRKKVI